MLINVYFNTQALFGGIPIILGNDFAQILPVVKWGTCADIIVACLQQSFLWPSLCILLLYWNMHVLEDELNQYFVTWVCSLFYNPIFTGHI